MAASTQRWSTHTDAPAQQQQHSRQHQPRSKRTRDGFQLSVDGVGQPHHRQPIRLAALRVAAAAAVGICCLLLRRQRDVEPVLPSMQGQQPGLVWAGAALARIAALALLLALAALLRGLAAAGQRSVLLLQPHGWVRGIGPSRCRQEDHCARALPALAQAQRDVLHVRLHLGAVSEHAAGLGRRARMSTQPGRARRAPAAGIAKRAGRAPVCPIPAWHSLWLEAAAEVDH